MSYFNPTEVSNTPQTNVITSILVSRATTSIEDPVVRAKGFLAMHHSVKNGLSFEGTKQLSLECVEEVLEHFFPDGEKRGANYLILNPHRYDSELGSFVINTCEGYWKDFADDEVKGADLISLIAFAFEVSQSDAAVMILEFIAGLKSDDGASIVKHQSAKKIARKSSYTFIQPIPDSAQRTRPTFFGAELGNPTNTWAYKNELGQPMFYVLRFLFNGKKEYRPLSYCKDSSGHTEWKMMAPPDPRPAYGLDRLATHPEATVIFNEGEKSADAAQRLFPDFVAVSTSNGAQSPEKTDFTPFSGRRVYIAPDNDDAGFAYKNKLIKLLRSVGAEVIGVLRLNVLKKDGNLPLGDGYDLADAEEGGWDAESLAGLGESLWEPLENAEPMLLEHQSVSKATSNIQSKPNDKKMSDLGYVVQFAMQNHGGNIACFSSQVLAYKNGYWAALDAMADIKSCLLDLMGDVKAKQVNAVADLLRMKFPGKPEDFVRKNGLTCLANGTLNPLTGELLPHSPEHHITNKLDITFDAEASCPLWMQTLLEIFEPDSDRDAKITLLQEYIGYCLIPDTSMCKFVWMIGPGGNGKSLILEVVEALIGTANTSNSHIDRFQNPFVRAELQGKLVNISSEMNSDATIADSYLKQIVSGDSVEVERKHEPSFSFKPYVRIFASTNKLPNLQDHSDGFARRAIFISFNRRFSEAEQDKRRKEKLLAELPGILNWAVEGLQRLMARSRFEIPMSSKEAVDRYRLDSDPLRQFAETFLQKSDSKEEKVASGFLYERYREWSLANGYTRPVASNKFAGRLEDLGFSKKKDSTGYKWNAIFLGTDTTSAPQSISVSPSASRYVV